jgi:hypothetical protein
MQSVHERLKLMNEPSSVVARLLCSSKSLTCLQTDRPGAYEGQRGMVAAWHVRIGSRQCSDRVVNGLRV